MKTKPLNGLNTQYHSQPSDRLSLPLTASSTNSNGFRFRFGKTTNSETTNHPSHSSQISGYRVQTHESRHRITRYPLCLFYPGHRASAVFFSFFVCSTVLIYMLNLFSTKLLNIESELADRNRMHEALISPHSLFHPASDISTNRRIHSGKRLASTQRMLTQDRPRQSYPARAIDNFRQSLVSKRLVLSVLKHYNPQNALTIFYGPQIAFVSPLTAIPTINEGGDGYAPPVSVHHVRNGRSEPHVPNSLSGSLGKNILHTMRPSIEKTSSLPVLSANATHLLKPRKTPCSVLHRDTPGSLEKEPSVSSFIPTGLEKSREPISAVTISRRPKELNKRSKTVRNNSEWGIEGRGGLSGQGRSRIREMKASPLSEDMIEIWLLRSGNSVCRIYNVGRLPEGRLVLPEWMKKHSMFLVHQCGVKEPVFAIKSRGSHGQFVFNKKRLNMTGWVRVVNNANMDLCDANTPRHHMPHFVSDILFPMRAMELLKGSGNGIEKLSFLRRSSSSNSPEVTNTAFPDLKPSIFLSEATWEASPSTWVWKLAKFFSHPDVRFSLLSEKVERRSSRRLMYNKKNLIWRFRSVLSSNLNPYEREGLFDGNGDNLVFSRNGLSGAPAFTIKGISQEPCRVSVTALTRYGSRALLDLNVLKEEATALFKSARLELDFSVIRFENAGFDTQVKTMRGTNVLIATHGAGNTNLIFMRRGATIIEVFPFAYRAGPFESFARTFGLEYKAAMSAPQTKVFKECMRRHEDNDDIRKKVFAWWDKAVAEEKVSPWVHRLELEKEFGEPGKSEGMATRRCVRTQQLAFDTKAVAAMALKSAKRQCNDFRFPLRAVRTGY